MSEIVTTEFVLNRHRGLIRMHSNTYTTPNWSIDDLAQEASIALWREMEKRPGDNLDKIASYIIKRRIIKLVTGEGAPFAHRDPNTRAHSAKNTISLEGFAETHMGTATAVTDAVASVIDRHADSPVQSAESTVVQEWTTATVRAALNALPPQWKTIGEAKLNETTDAVTATDLGVTRGRVSDTWRRHVAPALRVALADAA